ncbi:MAG: dihydroxy-acid dehydratase [Chloroflexi bacterium RBG_16_68_14]|nr:MAG: dihydroxy-acid dehydratase [Chloroflexi bacterium RBG_16_68_14]
MAMEDKGLASRLTEYGDREFALYLRRSFARSMGFSDQALGKPVVGIVNTFSELNNCHRGFRELAEAVKRGVWQAGGLPLEFPTISLGEVFLYPSSMMFRNLMSMDVEVMLRAQPLDAAVLMGGCDKTIPALLMGAASAGLPAIVLAAGPMLAGSYRGERLGACTDCRLYWARYRRGEIDRSMVEQVEGQLAPTAGTCPVMGTASTTACLTEAMGMMLPGGATIPAVHADRLRHAEETGKQAVELARSALTPDRIMTEKAFDNALRVLQALGGSTNAVIHLAAIAGRLGIRLDLGRLDELGETTPVLVDLKPSGQFYMEDFHRAGGMPVVLQELRRWLHFDALTVTGAALGELLDEPYQWPAWQEVIRPADEPLQEKGGLVVLKGSLAPEGAILKRSAASPELLNATGRAVVFTSLQDLAARIDDPDLDVRPDDFLVLQHAGPVGAPGMPEAGYLPIPRKLAGVKDMVRISDARMSGTAFGTVVLHVSPEAAVGGPLGLVRDGDLIELSVEKRQLNLLVAEDELRARRAGQAPSRPPPARGYERLYCESVQQAHLGADFAFLRHESLQGD